MDFWDILFKILAVIGSFGFVAAVIQYISTKNRQKTEHAHQKEMAVSGVQVERKTHIYLKLAEAEFDALREIWGLIFDLTAAISELIPILDEIPREISEQVKMYENRYKKFAVAYNNLVQVLNGNKPVISEIIFSDIQKLVDIGRKCGSTFRIYFCRNEMQLEKYVNSYWNNEKKDDDYRENIDLFNKIRDNIGNLIRTRYSELSVV